MTILSDTEPTVAAKCRICGRNLTVSEFRACGGVGHYCQAHLPASATVKARTPKRRTTPSGGTGRGAKVSESGVVEYPCKGQFASNGVIRRGKLTTDHPSCLQGEVVFVCKEIGYGPGEISTLFIKNFDGRKQAESTGFYCHD